MIKAFKFAFGLTLGFVAAVFLALLIMAAIIESAEACDRPEPVVKPIHQIHPDFLDQARERVGQ